VGRPRVIVGRTERQLEALLDAGVTQAASARALEVSRRTVSRWVAAERARAAGELTLEQLLAALEPPGDIVRALDEPPRRRRSQRRANREWVEAARRLQVDHPARWGAPPGADEPLGDPG
jgi:transcriptional regulator with XRE-family HTH domain